MKISLIKSLDNTFKIAFPEGYDTAKKIKLNVPYEFEFKNQRNVNFHRKYFSLLNLVVENTEKFKDVNHLRMILAIECGWYEDLINPLSGEITIIPKSISFAKMGNDEFEELYSKSIDYCCKILGVEKEDIINEISQHF